MTSSEFNKIFLRLHVDFNIINLNLQLWENMLGSGDKDILKDSVFIMFEMKKLEEKIYNKMINLKGESDTSSNFITPQEINKMYKENIDEEG